MIWLIIIAVMVLSFLVQSKLQSKFTKYSHIRNATGLTGAEVAQKMLKDNGIYDVKVISVGGRLTDHYNPQDKTVNLSEDVFYGNSVAAAAVAAHECGHAVQDATDYAPLRFRSAIVPAVSFANMSVQWILLAGILLLNAFPAIFWFGVALFAMTTVFSLVTLPVEVNASMRAVAWLKTAGITNDETSPMTIDALKWAAYTYLIAAIGSIATLLYYISIGNNRR